MLLVDKKGVITRVGNTGSSPAVSSNLTLSTTSTLFSPAMDTLVIGRQTIWRADRPKDVQTRVSIIGIKQIIKRV